MQYHPKLPVLVLAALLALFAGGPALADCFVDGQQVPEGTWVGGLVCVNGQWQPG